MDGQRIDKCPFGQDLTTQLKELSQRSYLLAYATAQLVGADPREVARSLPAAVNQLCTDGRPVPADSIEMDDSEVRGHLPELNQFMTDVLLVELQALLHTHLMLAAGRSLQDPAQQIESLLAELWPNATRGESAWAYREVILLTEIRNAVMHSRGTVAMPNQRLRDAGWSDVELGLEWRLQTRSFSDFLAFKRVVRTVSNEALPN